MEQYPRVQKVQRMLDVINRTITEAEREGAPGVQALTVWEGPEVGVHLRYGSHTVELAGELGLSGGEVVGLFGWAESAGYVRPHYGTSGRHSEAPMGLLYHLEDAGYEQIGELPDPQERLALILEAAIQTTRKDGRLDDTEKRRRIDLFEEAKFVVRTLGVEVAKAVWRGDIPPM
jgi:hypothetical protein